jgi:hypothetical protein
VTASHISMQKLLPQLTYCRFLSVWSPLNLLPMLLQVDQVMPAELLEPLGPPVGPDGLVGHGGGGGGGGMKREFEAGPGAEDGLMYGMGPGKDVYRQRVRQKARTGGDG